MVTPATAVATTERGQLIPLLFSEGLPRLSGSRGGTEEKVLSDAVPEHPVQGGSPATLHPPLHRLRTLPALFSFQ